MIKFDLMDKGRRNEITKLKFKKRLNALGLKPTGERDYKSFKHQSTPCSCFLCDPKKHGEKATVRRQIKLFDSEIRKYFTLGE